MFNNFLIKIFLLIPVWVLKFILVFHTDIKRKYIFDTQSQFLTYLLPKFDLHKVKDREIDDVRNKIEKKRLTNFYKHVCHSCNPKKFAQQQGVKQRQVLRMDASSDTPISSL